MDVARVGTPATVRVGDLVDAHAGSPGASPRWAEVIWASGTCRFQGEPARRFTVRLLDTGELEQVGLFLEDFMRIWRAAA